jgi:HEAT repeat protein
MNKLWSFIFIFCLTTFSFLSANEGRLLFLAQQGSHEQALKLYQSLYQAKGLHNYELLHRLGLAILDYGFRQKDREVQLMSLFGASVAAHEDVYYILEESLKNPHPQIQIVALSALASFQTDRADQALVSALGSPLLLIRYEAVKQLCKKKHAQALEQTESLMIKTPKILHAIYPPLFAMIGDVPSTRALRRLLNHANEEVRLATILSIAKYRRDDLLPQIHQQATQASYAQQEASAYALGVLKDESSINKLQRLALSPHPTVKLAAHLALYRLGYDASQEVIKQLALEGNVFAVAALADIPEASSTLIQLLNHQNLQVRTNALIALTRQRHMSAFDHLAPLLLHNKHDLIFNVHLSPGESIKAWKITRTSKELVKEDPEAYGTHVELCESLLEKVREGSETHLIRLAHQIFKDQQNDLVPITVELLEELGTSAAIHCLKDHQQQLGAPLVRHYCNLALYRLQEPGPYAAQLRLWVKNQSQSELIRFKPFDAWGLGEIPHQLSPEETSQLLIQSFEAFTINQDAEGIETLIDAMVIGNVNNRYALAGLLLRATQ